MKKLVVFASFLIASNLAFAQKRFETSYLSLNLPPAWSCQASGQEWVCRSSNKQANRRGFILLKAKLVGANESLQSYYEQLGRPISRQQSDKSLLLSKVDGIWNKRIGNQSWVDALHQDSEIKNYMTRYLVTVKGDLAISAQFNWHKDAQYPFKDIYSGIIQSIALKKNIASVQALPQVASTAETIPELDLVDEEVNMLDTFMNYYAKFRFEISAVALLIVMLPLVFLFLRRRD